MCKNINNLCLDEDANAIKIIKLLKNTSINLVKLLINFLQIPESGFLDPDTSFEETFCIYLKQMASNINDDSFYNQQLENLPKIIEIIEKYENDEKAMKGNLVKNMILIVIYLINIIERMAKKAEDSIFKCLYKNVKYNLKELLETKDKGKDNINIYKIFYEEKNKNQIILYDELFLYQCCLIQESNEVIEIKDIEFINKSELNEDTNNNKNNFKINNNIIINFSDEEGSSKCKELEEKFKELNNIDINKLDKYNLKNLLNYAEKL